MTEQADPSADTAVIIPAAGAGTRLGPGIPKALRRLGGEPLLAHAVKGAAAAAVGCLAVAAPPSEEKAVRDLVASALAGHPTPPAVVVVPGGADRQRSVAAALGALPASYDIVLVHDAARALTPAMLLTEVAAAVRAGHDAVIPVLPVTDTIIRVNSTGVSRGNLDRASLRAVQTPQGFRRDVLAEAHRRAAGMTATDDAGLVARIGVPVHTIPGSDLAFKITTPLDLAMAASLLPPAPESAPASR
jgi:2-C-methyl-D-erythritol 4-phosphate cytidylyltransferase